MKTTTDNRGNEIGNGSYHVDYTVLDFQDYPGINASVSMSETTESVYVTYSYNGNSVVVRFSDHCNNATLFGDQLNGFFATKNEILYRLGLITRTFVQGTRLFINSRMVKKSEIGTLYQVSDLTIQEMYRLGAGADLTSHTGKIAKDSNYIILGEKVETQLETRLDCFGNCVPAGKYVYSIQ
jgi:hypothetical protein